ncbi:MAG: DegT/DnrJ/EryC1/StrS family aminotransferase [Cyclobacteriaceae bacterium]|nr:DegT/DnrJ/EryC1/StrS family aminotransferase [Cyclobacteriaceae bacterium]
MSEVKYIPFLHIHPELKKEMVMEFEWFYDNQSYIQGSGLEKFEQDYAKFNTVKYGIGVGNGHDALLLALKCLDIGHGDEVIIPAHTFIASALAVANVGAKPVLADVDKDTFCISPVEIEQKISKKTRSIMPVHLYGNPCDMGAIRSIAQKYYLYIVEDNAQAQGAEFERIKTGSIGEINATSFYPTKNIGALGDGGMITTNNERLAAKARSLRNYGKSLDGQYLLIGINSRLDELQARMLSIKLKYLHKWNEERIEIAKQYESELKDVGEIQLQSTITNCKNVRHIFPILTEKRDELKSFLYSKGIETLIHFEKPIHFHHVFLELGDKKGSFPNAEKICESELSLPVYPGLKEEDITFVCDRIKKFYTNS